MKKVDRKQIGFIPATLFAMLFCIGGFHEYLSCIFSIVILVWLFLYLKTEKQLNIYKNGTSLAVCVMVIFYGLSALWAVDFGMAMIGFLKFLTLPLFMLGMMQRKENRAEIKHYLPYMTAIMVVVSAIGMQIPLFTSFFSVAGRLAGFFQYPNTFALLILVSELLILGKEQIKKTDYVVLIVLLLGLLYTGSRTVFVLAILSNFVLAILSKQKRVKTICLGGIAVVVVSVVIYALMSGGSDIIDRFLSISLEESTFVGRILYFIDALPLILKNPLGLGYMGYYYMQQSIQTGLYSVMYIHNDFLQIILDVGWVPFVLLLVAIVRVLLKNEKSISEKIILLVMIMHSCFDFNLQFLAVFCLFLVFLDVDSGKKIAIKKQLGGIYAGVGVVIVLSAYIGISLLLIRMEKYEEAYAIYPWNTQNAIVILTQTEDLTEAEELAQKILDQNEHVTIGYSVKARKAYSQGDFGNVIQYKNLIFEKAPFQYDEYEEYCYMLINGISLYMQAGDADSAKICKQELLGVRERLENLEKRLSVLGSKIKDQPQTELPEEIENYLDKLEVAE